MSDNDLIPLTDPRDRDPTPAGRYTLEIARRVAAQDDLIDDVELLDEIIGRALLFAARDIIAGRFVHLEMIGEFVLVDNRGPMIRYQADRRLIEGCCIHNLKQAAGG